MRIISGMAGGIRLIVPDDNDIRPTEDRVKETMFSIIGSLDGKIVLDLYSGTGALGLEALSRGASKVIMVEKNPRHAQAMEKNLAAVLKSIGNRPHGDVEILVCDVRSACQRLKGHGFKADVILADPPYAPVPGCFGSRELLLSQDYADLTSEDALMVLEFRTGTLLPWAPESIWHLQRQKTAGIRTIAFATRSLPAEQDRDLDGDSEEF